MVQPKWLYWFSVAQRHVSDDYLIDRAVTMADQFIVTFDSHGLSLEGRKFSEKQIMSALAEGHFRPGMRFRRGRTEFVLTKTGLVPRRRADVEPEEEQDEE